jgi:AraC-like DNA-binding protein
MWDGATSLEILLRGAAVGALIATAIALGRSRASLAVQVSGVLFSIAIIGYVVNSSDSSRAAVGELHPLFRGLSFGGVGAFWAFVLAMFEDRRLTLGLLAPFCALTAYGAAVSLAPPQNQGALWIAHNLVEVGLAAHALFVVFRSWRGDLVDVRRRLRGPFIASAALFAVVISAFEIGEEFGVSAAWYQLAGALGLAVFSILGTLVLLEMRSALFGAAVPAVVAAGEASGLNAADRTEIARVNALMDGGEAWKREGLTIGMLAQELRMPEHRLRRLINDQLGYRNFAAFVNARRIEAAKRLLADPGEARKTVASVAFDLGFGSLGPFNRAFKEATGQTPTEWRRHAMTSGKPDDQT